MSNSKYGRIIAILTAVCVILTGVAFIVCTAHLYFTVGDEPYSRESVGAYLKWLALPSALTIILSVWGVIYNVLRGERVEENAKRTSEELLESFESRYNISDFDRDTIKAVKALRKKQSIIDFIVCQVSAWILVFIVDYLFFIAEFSVDNLNADVMAAFAVILPLSAIALAIHIPRIYLAEKSAENQLKLLKESIKANGAPKVIKAKKKQSNPLVARVAILGVAVVLVLLGIFNEGVVDVLQKAVKICTECIGLG